MKAGDVLQEGVVVRHDDAGVWVGREAQPGEPCPKGHTEHQLGALRVFLSNDQAPIPPGGLHPTTAAKRASAAKRARR